MRISASFSDLFSKEGKAPRADLSNVILERTGPREITVIPKDDTGGLKDKQVLEDGSVKMNIVFKGKKFDWPKLGRAIFKIGIGMVAFDMSHEAALHPKYQPARDYIQYGGDFDNGMLVSMSSKPHPYVQTFLTEQFGGTGFMINIFGMIFMINLEPEPKLLDPKSFREAGDEIFERFGFELVSLKRS